MTKLTDYPFEIRPLTAEEGSGFLISYPDFSECLSDGQTVDEALKNGRDALKSTIAALKANDQPVPTPNSGDVHEIDTNTKERVQRLAVARQRSPHWFMHEAIKQYVECEEKRDAFRQDAIEAWDEYRATGLHTISGEADAWLAKLEAGQDVGPPACHG